MATPNRAPRRTATQMTTNVAQGTMAPGANTYQMQRKVASASDGAKNSKPNTSSGLTPGNVAVNK